MKIHVRHGDRELVFPSFRDFQNLYRHGFILPDDPVRRETSNRWIRACELPELRAIHLYDRSAPRRAFATVMWVMLAVFAVGVTLQLFLSMPTREATLGTKAPSPPRAGAPALPRGPAAPK